MAPLHSPGELICNVQNSHTKEIDAALRKSVVLLVHKARRQIDSILLEGLAVNNTISSLAKLADAIWFGNAVNEHIAVDVWTFAKCTLFQSVEMSGHFFKVYNFSTSLVRHVQPLFPGVVVQTCQGEMVTWTWRHLHNVQ